MNKNGDQMLFRVFKIFGFYSKFLGLFDWLVHTGCQVSIYIIYLRLRFGLSNSINSYLRLKVHIWCEGILSLKCESIERFYLLLLHAMLHIKVIVWRTGGAAHVLYTASVPQRTKLVHFSGWPSNYLTRA